jgi:hypothetical protein
VNPLVISLDGPAEGENDSDGSLVTQVSLDMIWKYIDGLWTVIFTKRVMLCFTLLTCVFGVISIFIALY